MDIFPFGNKPVVSLRPGLRAIAATAAIMLLTAARWANAQAFSIVHEFSGRGGSPLAGVIHASDGKLYGVLGLGGEAGLGSVYSLTPDGLGGYTYAELYGATPADGAVGFETGLLEAADGKLYGGTFDPGGGVIYRVDKSGNFAVLHTFTGSEGAYPSQLIQVPGGDFYGVTGAGQTQTAFRMDASGNVTVLHTFVGPEGTGPGSPLLLGSDGFLYGVCAGGGGGRGTVYRMDLSGSVTVVHSFQGSDGAYPQNGLIEASDGFLYGTTYGGGALDHGTIFRMDTNGTLTTLHSFSAAEGSSPIGNLLEASDGSFYGATFAGGPANAGTLFRVDAAGVFATLHEFSTLEGSGQMGSLVEDGGQLVGTAYLGGAGRYGTIYKATLEGSVQVVLDVLGAPEGKSPIGGLIQASDGLLYGTAEEAGDFGNGTLFRMDLSGSLTRLHSFDGATDGGFPQASLLEGSDGNLYGTAGAQGAGGHGTVFRSSTAGLFTTLHAFTGADGDFPWASVIESTDGNFYGTTYFGGSDGLGTAFRIDSAGVFAMIHEFSGADGGNPSGLIQGSDGDLYGTTVGGSLVPSFVFRMNASGAVTPVHAFADSGNSGNALLLASDGNYWGVNGSSVFRMEPDGSFFVVRAFQFGDSIAYPRALVEGADGSFYGTGLGDGEVYGGSVFRVDPQGNMTVIHRFLYPDSADPWGTLVKASDGFLYGTAAYGGQLRGGIVYRIDAAEVISIASVSPASGPASGGTSVTIGGSHFQPGATVTIGFMPATNVVVSGDNQITATAPALTAGAAYDVVVENPDLSRASRSRSWLVDAADVPASDLFHDAVNQLFVNGITVGCGGGLYCVDEPVSRAQMAVLILKSMLGWGYTPPPASGAVFADVPADAFAAAWIEDLAARGISVGCGGGSYCPEEAVTRAEMAPLLLKAAIGAGYDPPAATGDVFGDVPVDGFAAAWIEDLSAREIAAGCHVQPALYCPTAATTRGQMAALLVSTFGLP